MSTTVTNWTEAVARGIGGRILFREPDGSQDEGIVTGIMVSAQEVLFRLGEVTMTKPDGSSSRIRNVFVLEPRTELQDVNAGEPNEHFEFPTPHGPASLFPTQ